MGFGDAPHRLSNRPNIRVDMKCVLDEFPGYSWHVGWAPCKDFPALTEELEEHGFLFRSEILRHKSGLGGVRRVDLMRSGVAAGVELDFGSFLPCMHQGEHCVLLFV